MLQTLTLVWPEFGAALTSIWVWFGVFSVVETLTKYSSLVPFRSDGKGISSHSKLLVTINLQGPKQKRAAANEKTKTHHRKRGGKEYHRSVHAMIDM